MQNLNQYVEQQNRRMSLFKMAALDLKNSKDRQSVAEMLAGDLSPENISWDGERPRNEVAKAYRFLNACVAELKTLDPTIRMMEW